MGRLIEPTPNWVLKVATGDSGAIVVVAKRRTARASTFYAWEGGELRKISGPTPPKFIQRAILRAIVSELDS